MAVLALAVAGLALWKFHDKPNSIAVLPFRNVNANDYLTDGITDELMENLAEWRVLRVVGRASAFQFKGQSVTAPEIGRRLNSAALLEGSLTKLDGRYRIVAELIRARNGDHLWSHTYEVPPDQLQSTEAQIVQATAHALLPKVEGSGLPTMLTSTKNPDAHDLYLRARYYLAVGTTSAVHISLHLAREAIDRDPSYPLPYESVGLGEWVLGSAERALAALDKAIALRPGFGDAHALRGAMIHTHNWDWPGAEREYRLALESGSSKVHGLYGWSLATRGRFAEAEKQLRIAEDLDPLAPVALQNRAYAFAMNHKYAEAKKELRHWLELDPKSPDALFELDQVAAFEGHYGAEEARGQLPKLQGSYQRAHVYALLGDANAMFDSLQKAADNREPGILWLKLDPLFSSFRNDPRFVALQQRLGL